MSPLSLGFPLCRMDDLEVVLRLVTAGAAWLPGRGSHGDMNPALGLMAILSGPD